ncbi:MAG: DUF748 domain-containing protein [Candidatus Binatia bacterium]
MSIPVDAPRPAKEAPAFRPSGNTRRLFATAALALIACALLILGLVAASVRPLIERQLSSALRTPVTIQSLAIKPWRAVVDAHRVAVGPPEAGLSAARVTIAADLWGVLHGDINIDRVVCSGISATVAIDDSSHVTVAGLPERPRAADRPHTAAARQVRIRELVATDATVRVRHAIQGTPQTVRVQLDSLHATNIALATDGSGLRLDAIARGDAEDLPLEARASVWPAGDTRGVAVRVDFRDVVVPNRLLELPPSLARFAGTLDGSLTYRGDPLQREHGLELSARIRSARLSGRADTMLLAQDIEVDGLRVDLTNRHIHLGTITVEAPQLTAAVTSDGMVLPVESDAGQPPTAKAFAVVGGRIDVTGGQLTVRRGGERYALAIDSARVAGFSPESGATVQLDARTPEGGAVQVSGALRLAPVSTDLELSGTDIEIAKLMPLAPQLPARITGGRASGTVTGIGTDRLRVDASVRALRATGDAGSAFAAQTITLAGTELELARARIDLGTIEVKSPTITSVLTEDGLVLPIEERNDGGIAKGPAWALSGGQVRVSGGKLIVQSDARRYELALESGRFDGVTSDRINRIELTATGPEGGALSVTGAMHLTPPDVDLGVSARAIGLAALTDILPALPLRIARGTASGTLSVEGPPEKLMLRGDVQLYDLHTAPPAARRPEEVLAVHRVEASLSVDWARRSVEVGKLELSYPYIMVERSAEALFPYSALARNTADARAGDPEPRPIGTEPPPADAMPPPPDASLDISIRELTVVGGRLEFIDRTVQPEYWTALADLSLTASRVALPGPEGPDVATFRVTALQDELNPIEITGEAEGDAWRVRVDLRSLFLPTLNAYLAPIIGYKADRGVLSLEVDGRVSPDNLHATNYLTLRNVSVTQTGLDVIQRDTGVPLPIALALLKNPQGTIGLAVPTEGDPRARTFRLGSFVNQALSKAVLGALASPLKLLGLLFGREGPTRALAIDPVPFAAGSSTLHEAAQTRLAQIARILAAHTELTLVAKPDISPQDEAAVGGAGLQALADRRAAVVTQALVGGAIQPRLAKKRLVMVPWEPPSDGALPERTGVYVELQLSADYGN